LPVAASSASTWLAGVDTNITPPFTIGAASCTRSTPVGIVHTGASRATFAVVI
jgi:hypothetical protein